VTWNGRGFDLPVLALRALRFGLDFRWYYRGEGYRYRFTEEGTWISPTSSRITAPRG
jgi:predicted PolB exonuclease-like 3'-5' exonuclease